MSHRVSIAKKRRRPLEDVTLLAQHLVLPPQPPEPRDLALHGLRDGGLSSLAPTSSQMLLKGPSATPLRKLSCREFLGNRRLGVNRLVLGDPSDPRFP